ncbi:MAG: hypothetical protein MR897_07955 [Bacteroidales bacterium]|nr:hypothetical protein [Bacteroidales bacterium]
MKYHVPTGLCFSPKARGFYPFGDATDLVRGQREGCGVADFKPLLEIRHAAALTTGAKHWHR